MFNTYTIYCLIDPRNNEPYYVGCSWNKYTLKNRLARHVAHANTDKHVRYKYKTDMSVRHEIVYQLKEQGKQPIIRALFIVTPENINNAERQAYYYLTGLGFVLFQDKYRFCYSNKSKHATIK